MMRGAEGGMVPSCEFAVQGKEGNGPTILFYEGKVWTHCAASPEAVVHCALTCGWSWDVGEETEGGRKN